MIFEHEIPSGSKLYFNKSAKIKRELESIAASFFEARGFKEIVTPAFSYHQHESFDDKKVLIRINDSTNHEVTLRADSTIDVVRIVTKRLGRSTQDKKWFYIQPVFTFPTNEQYQIGAEIIEGNMKEVAKIAVELFERLDFKPILQIANIAIPKILHSKYNISINDIKEMNIESILNTPYSWIEDLEDLSKYPMDIKEELLKIKEIAKTLLYKRIIISPLYYAQMLYYDSLLIRAFEDNNLYLTGGEYIVNDINGAGFALNLDALIARFIKG
ncbi:MAG: ATP phosphoribosyltransferase regulatory subunit [Epsilonproteobacteria bacterium]|nr:ATP phosphoribosyltransferase regulatory subunit [Campylobacterota bacterium]